MGMFDTINMNLVCPYCGELINEWQTKDLYKCLQHYTPNEAREIMLKEYKDEIRIIGLCKNIHCREFINLYWNYHKGIDCDCGDFECGR